MILTGVFAVILYNAGTSAQYGFYPNSCSNACENDVLLLTCLRNYVIHVDYVYWGSPNGTAYWGYYSSNVPNNICGGGYYNWNCYGYQDVKETRDAVINSCEGKTNCNVGASRAVLGNPCLNGGSRYLLRVCYSCGLGSGNSTDKTEKPDNTTASTTATPSTSKCKRLSDDDNSVVKRTGEKMTLRCDEDESINLRIAIYGTKNKGCNSSSTVHIENIGSRKKTFKYLYKRCQGWRKCTIPVKYKRFGNRKGKNAFLQVVYSCSDKELRYMQGIARCNGRDRIFLNRVNNNPPTCVPYTIKQCERKQACNSATCQARYSCQKPKRYHRGGGGGGSSGSEESGGSSESEESNESDEPDDHGGGGGYTWRTPVTWRTPATRNPNAPNCTYRFYNNTYFPSDVRCPLYRIMKNSTG